MTIVWGNLVQTSLRNPREAAEQIIGLDLPRDALWTALTLVALINTVVLLLVLQISEPTFPLPSYFERPLALFVLLAGSMVLFVHAMYWAGLALGGKGGELAAMLGVVIWFQALRAAAQIVVIATSFLAPAIGSLLSVVVAVWGFWIFLNFVAAAARLSTAIHALAVLIVAGIGLALGLGVLVGLIGILTQGVTG